MSKTSKRTVTGRRRNPSTRRSHSGRSDSGGKLTVPTNPPQITYQPWYPLTLAYASEASIVFTPAKIVNMIRAQLDPHSHGFIPVGGRTAQGQPLEFRLQFRLISVRSWNLTGRQIALAINDYSVRNATGQDQICGLVDSGTALHVPCVGFRLPSSLANLVMRNDNDDKDDTLVDIISPTGSSTMTYLDVHWRFDGPIKLTSNFRSDMSKLLLNQQKVKQTLDRTSAAVEHIMQVADDAKPSFVRRVIDGSKLAAEVVTIAAGEEDEIRAERLDSTLNHLVETLSVMQVTLDRLSNESPRLRSCDSECVRSCDTSDYSELAEVSPLSPS